MTPGYDGVGRVLSTGPGVSGLSPGDVCAFMPQHGCFATSLLLPASRVVPLPDAASMDPVAVAPLVLTVRARKSLEGPKKSGGGNKTKSTLVLNFLSCVSHR